MLYYIYYISYYLLITPSRMLHFWVFVITSSDPHQHLRLTLTFTLRLIHLDYDDDDDDDVVVVSCYAGEC